MNFTNCTFAGNVATNTTAGAGAAYLGKNGFTFVNCILANNYNASGASDIILNHATYNLQLLGTNTILSTPVVIIAAGTDNLTANLTPYTSDDPLFAAYTTNDAYQVIPVLDATTGTIPLKNTSIAAIGVGATSYSGVTIPSTDQRGITRKAIPDLGAYEYNYHNDWLSTANNTTWAADANWSNGTPILADTAVINVNVNNKYPELSGDVTVESVVFAPGASLELGEFTLSATSGIQAQASVDSKKWYSVGFPFNIAEIYSKEYDVVLADNNYWLQSYNGTAFTPIASEKSIAGNTGYIIQFPDGYSESIVSYTSEEVEELGKGELNFDEEDVYVLQPNPTLARYPIDAATLAAGGKYIYKLSYDVPVGYVLVEEEAEDAFIEPFESVITFKSTSVSPAPKISLDTDVVTGIEKVANKEAVVATQYYNLQGVRVGALRATPLQPGIYIVKTIYESGKSEVSKIIK
ncbi:hypothetical protein FACS189413_03060 [Bacteroidia bacterium]|nr:hypothetical protein FACS189413_03060 [Bacteroidia bacterium]